MHRKIDVADLVVGMYLQEFVGQWIDNPFWRKSFLITNARDVALIRASKAREVWIDTAKGLDLPTPVAQMSAARPPASRQGAKSTPALPVLPETAPVTPELHRAARICAQGKEAVADMFREARMGNAIDTAGVAQLVQDISDSVTRNTSALISLARLKTADDYTYMHSVAVCAMMIALARQLGLDEEETCAAGVAGLLHDMGKALLPPAVLNKPGKLTAAEYAIVRSHPELGHRILLSAGGAAAMSLDVCLHHHEKMDSTGYPKGLRGDQISLHARMAAVCDVYDAITSNRPYKQGWDPAESMRQMGQWAGSHFDPLVFQAFAKCLGIYPIGSLVRLASGWIGVVIAQTAGSLTTPVVKVFYSTRMKKRIPPEDLDLSVKDCRERILGREDPAKWNFPDLNAMWSGLPQVGSPQRPADGISQK
ncbi:MAG: HD-GYP domain-containing protein [Rhodoferax sp.]|nr:HD-GYP domain-containing protein [Rhodoferax sp.]